MEGRPRRREAAGGSRRLSRERARRARLQARRRLAALGLLAAISAVAGAVAGAGEDPAEGLDPAAAEVTLPPQCLDTSRAGVRRALGARLVVRWDGSPDASLERRVRAREVGGVILFPAADAEPAALRAQVERLQRRAAAAGDPPLLVAIDQEGGPVKRLPAGPPQIAPLTLAESGSTDDARLEGAATGRFLRDAGVNADLAPVLDVAWSPDSAIATRAFGDDARSVTALGLAFAEGLRHQGVAAAGKHFPGLGRSTINTDLAEASVEAPAAALRRDLEPFRAAAGAGVEMIMIGLAEYPALGVRGPAALSPRVVEGLLRREIGFDGVAITDDLGAGAVRARYGRGEAAVAAARAGEDLLLFANDADPDVLEDLERAQRRGVLDAAAQRRSCARVITLRERLSAPMGR